MKTIHVILLSLVAGLVHAQGTFVYDQQSVSSDDPRGTVASITGNQLIGQSFTPSLDAVGFIRLRLGDVNIGNGLGAVVAVNLRANAVDGPILRSTDPVSMPDGFVDNTTFLFPSPVSVNPGTVYFFQPVVVSGDNWFVFGYNFYYPGGTAYFLGQPNAGNDLWFREGIIIPEPSAGALLLLGCGLLAWRKHLFLPDP